VLRDVHRRAETDRHTALPIDYATDCKVDVERVVALAMQALRHQQLHAAAYWQEAFDSLARDIL
jgi:hypothetical protein